MNKSEFIKEFIERNDGAFKSKAAAERALNSVFAIIADAVKNDDTVVIQGFGSFSPVYRKQREGRNVSTGEPITIPATVAPKFAPAKGFREAVASSLTERYADKNG